MWSADNVVETIINHPLNHHECVVETVRLWVVYYCFTNINKQSLMWRFPEMGPTPSHHPFRIVIFHEIIHPVWGYPHLWNAPYDHVLVRHY